MYQFQILLPTEPAASAHVADGSFGLNPLMDGERLDITEVGCQLEELAALWCVLTNRQYQPAMVDDQFPLVSEDTQWGPWLHLIPRELVQELAYLTPFQVALAARQWSHCDEPPLADPDMVRQALTELHRLAAAAAEGESVLLFWACLSF